MSAGVPVQRLSDQILLEIFKEVWNPQLNAWHVCRGWRTVICRYSAFWSKLLLDMGKRGQDLKAACWLGFAAGRKLYVNITGLSRFASSDVSMELIELAMVLRGSLGRWRSISIEGASPVHLKTFFSFCSGNAPLLKSITIEGTTGLFSGLFLPFLIPRHSENNLVMRIDCQIPDVTCFGPAITDLHLNLHNEFVLVYGDEILDVLRSCPNLVQCDLNFVSGLEVSRSRTEPSRVNLPRLTSFTATCTWDVVTILFFLDFPSITDLSLENFSWTQSTPRQLWSFFERCASTPKYISLYNDGPDVYGNDVVSLEFHQRQLTLPSVTRFNACGNTFADAFLDALSLPRAESIELSYVGLEVIRSLLTSSGQLRSVCLYFEIEDITNPHDETLALISVPSITILSVDNDPRLVSHFHAPNLESLTLSGPFRDESHYHIGPSLLLFTQNSSLRHLHFLDLFKLTILDDQFSAVAQHLEYLSELRLRSCQISDNILSQLSVKSPAGLWVLPRLETIYLARNENVTPMAFVKLLESRNKQGPDTGVFPLVKGCVRFLDNATEQEFKKIQVRKTNYNPCTPLTTTRVS